MGASLQLAHSSIRVRSLIIWPSAQSIDFFLDRTLPQSQSLFCAVRDIYLTIKPIVAWTACKCCRSYFITSELLQNCRTSFRSCMVGSYYCCQTVQVSDLIAAKQFQKHSGPVLETLSLRHYGHDCFDFAAPPEAYPVRCGSCQTARLLPIVAQATLTLHAACAHACMRRRTGRCLTLIKLCSCMITGIWQVVRWECMPREHQR